MKSQIVFCLILSLFLSLFFIKPINAQKNKKQFKSYLIINNSLEVIKEDSAFKASLRTKVFNELKKKNYLLILNTEMEEADKSYLYIYVDISDSLKISARKSSYQGHVIIIPYPERSWKYKDGKDIIKLVSVYIKKYL